MRIDLCLNQSNFDNATPIDSYHVDSLSFKYVNEVSNVPNQKILSLQYTISPKIFF